jgi:hypothetical protein
MIFGKWGRVRINLKLGSHRVANPAESGKMTSEYLLLDARRGLPSAVWNERFE